MKTIPFLALFATLILTSSYVSAVIAPDKPATISLNDFDHFRVHRQGSGVALSWAAGAPDVSYFLIERSWDGGQHFEQLLQVPSQGNGTHKYLDEEVLGGTYHYRIVAVKFDESSIASAVESVRIVKRK